MKLLTSIFTGVLLLGGGALAQPPTGKGYDAFNLMQTRNIFDPTRRANRVAVAQQRPERNERGQRNRGNSLTLTGTMVRDGKSLAFFSGTRSELSKVLPVGEPIDNFRVTRITTTQVELQRDGAATVLEVGHTLPLEGSAGPEPGSATAEETPPANPEAPSTSTAAAPLPVAPAATNDKTEIMRRLMERRAKEMTK